VIDLTTNYIETIPASYPGFMAIAVNETTNRVYAANMNSDANYVLAIDGEDNSTTTIAVGDYPDSVVVNAAADTIYVGNVHGYSTSVIDGASNTVKATITGIDNGPGPGIVVALNDVTNEIYGITQYRRPPPIYSPKNMFSVIDCAGNTVQQTGQQGFPSVASAVAINTASNRIYTAQGEGNQIQVFDGANPGALPVQITVGETPMGIAIDPATGTLYVSNWGSNTVSIISGA
jgi:YVTN family beta-propeller protein